MQVLPGFTDRVFLHNRFWKIHQGRNGIQRWVRAQKRWRFSLGAYDGDGTMDGASCLKFWRQLQRSGGSSGFQPSLTAESPLIPQKGEFASWLGEKDFPKMTWYHLNPLNNLGLQSKWNKWTLRASVRTDVIASAQELFNPCLKN